MVTCAEVAYRCTQKWRIASKNLVAGGGPVSPDFELSERGKNYKIETKTRNENCFRRNDATKERLLENSVLFLVRFSFAL